jgi:Flp pilus assembly protein TadB
VRPALLLRAMGRSRRRARTAATAAPAPRAAERKRAAATTAAAPDVATRRRRTLASYLTGAMVLAVLVILGTVTLLGTLGPFIVLVVAVVAAFGLRRWMLTRLADVELSAEDRTLQTMASGLLGITVAFAAIAALVISLA